MSLVYAAAPSRAAGPVGVEYVKTIGQTNLDGDPLLTLGGQLALDGDGNLYCGTPGGASRLQKLTPQGRVVWHHHHNVPGFQGCAVDAKYVYTCGAGYYGYRQVQRWDRASGAAAAGWQHEWKKDEPSAGVRPMKMPVSLAVDDRYLYVADRAGEELRRLDKATGAEAPFGKRVMVVDPRGLALTADGNLLILTAESLLEVDPDGKPLRVPLIDELHNAVSIAVDARRGRLYVAEGGPDAEPTNRVRAFGPDGKPSDFRLGVGGKFQGPWSPTSFAFFDGTGALAVAPDGGLWVNPGWAHHLGAVLPTLHRFDLAGKHVLTLRGVNPSAGIAVDDHLDSYAGGTAKLSWDDQVVWTIGLAQAGRPPNLPFSHPHWPTRPTRCGDRLFLYGPADGALVEVGRDSGAPLAKPRNVKANMIVVGGPSFLLLIDPAKGGSAQRLDLAPDAEPKPAVTLADLAGPVASAALADDGQTLLVLARDGQLTAHATSDGSVKWRSKSAPNATALATAGGYAFAARPAGPGVQVLRLADGAPVATFGESPVDARPAIPATADLAAVSRTDGTYVFAAFAGAIRAYRL